MCVSFPASHISFVRLNLSHRNFQHGLSMLGLSMANIVETIKPWLQRRFIWKVDYRGTKCADMTNATSTQSALYCRYYCVFLVVSISNSRFYALDCASINRGLLLVISALVNQILSLLVVQ